MWTFLKEIHTLDKPCGFENRGEPAGFPGSPFLASLNVCFLETKGWPQAFMTRATPLESRNSIERHTLLVERD